MKIYNKDVMESVRQYIGLDDETDTSRDEEIMKMDKETVFEYYCKWNGLLGSWYHSILQSIGNIYDVKL